MNKGILVVLLVALLPLAVFAQEDVDSTYLSDDLQDKLGIKSPLEDNTEEIEEETELVVVEPENLVIETPELVPAGSARDSPFYSIDRFVERLRLRITGDEVAKAQLKLKFAEERLSEAKKLIELNKQELADKTLVDYSDALQNIELDLASTKELGKDVEPVVQQFSEMTVKHVMVLQKILVNVPDTAKPVIMNAIEVSQKGQEKAILSLAQIRTEKELTTVEDFEEVVEEIIEAVDEALAEEEDVEETTEEPVDEEVIEEEPVEEEVVEEEPVEEEQVEEAQSEDESSDETSAEEPAEETVEIDTSQGKGWH